MDWWTGADACHQYPRPEYWKASSRQGKQMRFTVTQSGMVPRSRRLIPALSPMVGVG